MRTFILCIVLATASLSTVRAVPSSNVAIRSRFRDDTDAIHEPHRPKLHDSVGKDHARPRQYNGPRVDDDIKAMPMKRDLFARVWRKNGVLSSRFIKNADYGAGDPSTAASPAPTQEPAPPAGPAKTAQDVSPTPSAG
ncbi:hypothetical protein BV22DRAFT_1133305 [Leucogyrophana mollusca]|uniref:Uncharacterized protein n=1 Tax=Leucogyrophana mollusca TaxID=85980 RepID=A0ACB8B3Z3_9AGAM|nr:hypothetical protein BV22DRAFT_1133305 [Leucogyrophana mollusca]